MGEVGLGLRKYGKLETLYLKQKFFQVLAKYELKGTDMKIKKHEKKKIAPKHPSRFCF